MAELYWAGKSAEEIGAVLGRQSPERMHEPTWPQLVAALRVAVRALGPLTDSSREAREALDYIDRILSEDWDGREGLD